MNTTTIVVADDDPPIRRLIAYALTRRGYEVLEAEDGEEALALIRRALPALAVLDVMMPGMSGLQVTQALAQDAATAGIPVMIVSAKGQAAEVEAGLGSGARAYMVKPFAPRELAARVAELLTKEGAGDGSVAGNR